MPVSTRILMALFLGVFVTVGTGPATAGTEYSCPDLSQAKQVLDCPTDEELRRMFRSTCGGENAPDAKEPELCDAFAEFKRQKNNALWESADGEFMGYLTCNRPPEEIKKAKAAGIGIGRRGKLTKISCVYDGGVKMTRRTRETCTVPGMEIGKRGPMPTCGPDPATCKVVCE